MKRPILANERSVRWLARGIALCTAACMSDAAEPSLTMHATRLTSEPQLQDVPIPYDRDDNTRLDPFPDDYFLVSDPTTHTGQRIDMPAPAADAAVQTLMQAGIALTRGLDGMSPLAPVIVALPDALDLASIPQTPEASLAIDGSIALIDLTPTSPDHAQRVPFWASLHSGAEPDGNPSHTLVVFPAKPLLERGRYAFVITRGARTRDGRQLGPSSYMQELLSGAVATPRQERSASNLRALLPELASAAITAQDIALLLSISVRSTSDMPQDLLAVRSQLRAAAPPTFRVLEAEPSAGDIAAIVTGEWQPLSFRDGIFLGREPSGTPRAVGTERIRFTLALPRTALDSPAPLVMYQHGNPGSAEAEVPIVAQQGLAADGFAVLGFTDVLSREISSDGATAYLQLFSDLLLTQRMPDYLSRLTLAEQLAFLRLIPQLSSIDLLPLGAPDGRPDLDPTQPLAYLGISAGGQHGAGLVAFAPELRTAALSAAAGRLGSTLIQQLAEPAYAALSLLAPKLTRAQLLILIVLMQMGYDDQDPQNLARFAFREPVTLDSPARACVLLVEGIADALVPVHSTRSSAWQLDLPQLQKAADVVTFLPSVAAPLRCEPSTGAHGAFYQYVPRGVAGFAATPGCAANADWGSNGHRCAHHAPEALHQRRTLFKSALSGSPELIDPL